MPTSTESPTAAIKPLHRRLSFLVTPRWIILIIVVIVFALACYMLLAPWQFSRSAEQDALNEQLATAVATPAAPVSQLMSSDQQPADDVIWREVTATGRFEADRQAYIRLRHNNDGEPASEVVAPFVTKDGTVVLVDRGYVLLTDIHAGAPLPPLPSGTVTVTGRVQADQVDPRHRPASVAQDGLSEYTAASSDIASSYTPDSNSSDSDSAAPDAVYLGYLQLTPDSPGVIDAIALPQQDPGPFFSYALQWLAFGAIAVAGIGYFAYREFSDPVDDDIYLSDPDSDSGGSDRDSSSGTGDRDDMDQAMATGRGAGAPPSREKTGRVIGENVVGRDTVAAGKAPTSRRGRRAQFDKSQLYDAE